MQKREKGIALSYLHTGVNMVCGLFLSAYLLRMLGDVEYGIYQTVASFANYLVLLEFGTGAVMTRNLSMCRGLDKPQAEINRNASTVWTLTAILTLAIAAASWLFSVASPGIFAKSMTAQQIAYGRKILIFITGYLIFAFLHQTVNGAILAYEKYTFASLQNLIRTVTRTLVLVLLVAGWQYSILIAAVDMVLNGLCFLWSYRYCRRTLGLQLRIGKMDKTILAGCAPLCVAIFLQAIVNQANNNVDKFIIGITISPESVTLYSVAMYIFSIFSSLTTIPVSMYAPAVIQKVGANVSRRELTDSLAEPCRLTAMLGGLVLFGFVAAGRQFICLFYGEAYSIAWPIAIVIMVPMYINMVNGVLVNVLDALNKRLIRSVALLVTTAANIVLTVFWLKWWGLIGAALATAVCTFLGQVLFMNIYYQKALHIPVLRLFREAFRGVLLWLVVGCGLGYWVGTLLPNTLLSFIASGATFVAAALGGHLLFGADKAQKAKYKALIFGRKHHG